MPFARLLLLSILLALPAWAHALVFAVNEGVTYRVSADEIRARYAAIATDLGKLLGQPVRVEPIGDYKELRGGLAAKSYDLALVHPAHLSITAIKSSGYRLLAVTKGYTEYRASFLVRKDSPYQAITDLKGLKIGAPDEDSITSWMVRATLRETFGDTKAATLNYTRFQDAVPFMVEHTFTQAGATAANGLVKDWKDKGGRVIGTTKPVPIKHLLASSTLSAQQQQQVRDYFIGLDSSEAGRKKLEPIKVQGYAPYDEAAMLKLGAWLGL
jgi:phosphonate transport system substrate-binding protein